MKLKTMTQFVLDRPRKSTLDMSQIDWLDLEIDKLNEIRKYALFLSKELKKEMFIPCDENGDIINEPIPENFGKCINKRKRLYEPIYNEFEIQNYNNALEKVLFKTEFSMNEENANYFISNFKTIDELSQLYEFELTGTSIKIIS